MLFSKARSSRTTFGITMVACLAFVALAVWGWGLPLESVWNFFVVSLALIVLLMLAAVIMVVLIRLLKRLLGSDKPQ